jgi:hypothetical protein
MYLQLASPKQAVSGALRAYFSSADSVSKSTGEGLDMIFFELRIFTSSPLENGDRLTCAEYLEFKNILAARSQGPLIE